MSHHVSPRLTMSHPVSQCLTYINNIIRTEYIQHIIIRNDVSQCLTLSHYLIMLMSTRIPSLIGSHSVSGIIEYDLKPVLYSM
jgi:hypothetical protein